MIKLLKKANSRLAILDALYENVQEKSKRLAEYFCDERSDFLERVFEEMWQFMEAFVNAEKVCLQLINDNYLLFFFFLSGCCFKEAYFFSVGGEKPQRPSKQNDNTRSSSFQRGCQGNHGR